MTGWWIDTGWSKDNVTVADGTLRLELNTDDRNGKGYTGGEITSMDAYGYGRYEVTMKASGEAGVNSSFFTYTGQEHGTAWNEIDFEFLGKDPTKVSVAYHNSGASFSNWVDLGFDASAGFHEYAIEWEPDQIRWYADDKLIYTVVDPKVDVPTIPSKIIANIWTGMPGWLGETTFTGETAAYYKDVAYKPYVPGTNYDGTPRAPVSTANGLFGEDAVALYLVNTNNGLIVQRLTDDAVIKVATRDLDNLSIIATTAPEFETILNVESVVFDLSGTIDKTRTESFGLLALFGENAGVALPGLSAGSFTLETTGYSQDRAAGTILSKSTLDFTIEGTTTTPTPSAPSTEIFLYDAKTDTLLTRLTDGMTLSSADLGSGELTIVAKPVGIVAGTVESVTLKLDGPGTFDATRTENFEPYAMFGETGTTELNSGGHFPVGDYALSVATWSGGGGAGTRIDALDIDFTITAPARPAPPPPPSDYVLHLVDADEDRSVGQVADGAVLDLDALGVALAAPVVVVRKASPLYAKVESVVMSLDGPVDFESTQSQANYALFGKAGRDFAGKDLEPGDYTLTFAAYSGNGGTGTSFGTFAIDFEIV